MAGRGRHGTCTLSCRGPAGHARLSAAFVPQRGTQRRKLAIQRFEGCAIHPSGLEDFRRDAAKRLFGQLAAGRAIGRYPAPARASSRARSTNTRNAAGGLRRLG